MAAAIISRVSGCSASVDSSALHANRGATTLDSNVVLNGPSFYPPQEPENPLKRILNLCGSVALWFNVFSLPGCFVKHDRRGYSCVERLHAGRMRDCDYLIGLRQQVLRDSRSFVANQERYWSPQIRICDQGALV